MRKTGIKKAVAAFSLCMGVLAFLCFGIPGEAAKTAAHDLKITGGEYGQDYRYDNNILLILSDTPLTISGTTRKAVSYTHLTLPTTSRRQRQMCIRDRC